MNIMLEQSNNCCMYTSENSVVPLLAAVVIFEQLFDNLASSLKDQQPFPF